MTYEERIKLLVDQLDEKHKRLVACAWAERSTTYFCERYPEDTRLADCLAVARAYAYGTSTMDHMNIAHDQAYAATGMAIQEEMTATSSADPAGKAVWMAALSVLNAVAYGLSRATLIEVARAANTAVGEAATAAGGDIDGRQKAIDGATRVQEAIASSMLRQQHKTHG